MLVGLDDDVGGGVVLDVYEDFVASFTINAVGPPLFFVPPTASVRSDEIVRTFRSVEGGSTQCAFVLQPRRRLLVLVPSRNE